MLAGNWREGVLADGTPYGFTCPAPPRYRHQWYWDSCFHAIVWRHFSAERAREELRTLVRAGRLDGFIPHTAFWHDSAGWRRAPFYATNSRGGDRTTAHIQTPLLALAWELVAESSPDDPGFASEGLDALRLHYDWLEHHRDPDGDGLIAIIHPDESGLDDSPKYDPVFGWMSHYLPGYFWLVERSRRLNYESRAIIARYDEHVEDVLVNVIYALSLRALARLSGDQRYHERAARTENALIEHCWDDERGLFFDLAGHDHTPLRVSTWSSLAPLALPSLREEIATRLIEEHLLDARRYRARYGIPSVSMEEPSFRAGWHLFRCWRGPSWINVVWLLAPAMRRFGYHAEADRIVSSCVELVSRHGFREYYNPLNGEGLAARRFGWSTLLVDLMPAAADVAGADGDGPFTGSIGEEIVSMGLEAAAGTLRMASAWARALRKGYDRIVPHAEPLVDEIANELATWPGVRIERRADGTAVAVYEQTELGVLDPVGAAVELPVLDAEHDELVASGAAEPDPDAGGVRHDVHGPADVTAALELLDRRYRDLRGEDDSYSSAD